MVFGNYNDNKYRNRISTGVGITLGSIAPLVILSKKLKLVTPEIARERGDKLALKCPDIDTFEKINEIANNIVTKKGLDKKGVTIVTIEDEIKNKDESVYPRIRPARPKCVSYFKSVKYSINKRIIDNLNTHIKEGANASYSPYKNQITISNKRNYSTVFHELGHAMNANGNVFIWSIAKSSYKIINKDMPIITPIALVAKMYNNNNYNQSDNNDSLLRLRSFLANNVTALTAASFIPTLTEEGLASIRGLMAVKKYLPKSGFKQLIKNYSNSFNTYVKYASRVTMYAAGISGIIDLIKYGTLFPNYNKNRRKKC